MEKFAFTLKYKIDGNSFEKTRNKTELKNIMPP